jgi:long-chain acyl-CoA synthetase
MELSFWKYAGEHRDEIAVVDPDGKETSFGELLDTSNALVHGLRDHGFQPRDCLAFVLPNCTEVLAVFMAAAQAGWYVTPINWHLATPEIAYILQDCEAKAVVCHEQLAEIARAAADEAGVPADSRFSVGSIDGFRPLETLTQGQPTTAPTDRRAGGAMTYTSGTTGRPKGVRRAVADVPPETASTMQAMFLGMFGILPGQAGVHLTVAPLYHTAVINFASNHLHLGHKVVLMDKWTPRGMLARIDQHGVTNSHMVPTHFVRLLKLPAAEREAYDISSLRNMIHGAAPCPIEVKRQMLAWWGPCIYEYYAASEGGGTLAPPDEWLKKPGTVGKPWPISEIRILDDAKQPLPAGTHGTVWIRMGDHRFEYHGDERKTDEAWNAGFFTVGDAGYLDEDGYLFLCDRKADMIISGGVNIYPAEIEAVLILHPHVGDVAVFGIPDEEWGEQVKAVIEPVEGVAAEKVLADELLAFCAGQLAKYKTPRSIDFIEVMPRDPNGKLTKRTLRDPYWVEHGRNI